MRWPEEKKRANTKQTFCDSGSHLYDEQYENLRNYFMNVFLKDTTNNQELALFLSQGMFEWLRVWSKCAPSKPVVKDRNEESSHYDLSDNSRTQVVILLTNMALDNYQGVKTIW